MQLSKNNNAVVKNSLNKGQSSVFLRNGSLMINMSLVANISETSEMTALAAAGDGLEHGLLEAAALLNEGAAAVLLVITEEQPPHAYASWIRDVPFPYALGLLLTPGDEWQLELTTGTVQLTQTQWPHALNLLRTLLTEQGACQHAWKNRVWNWQRKP